MTLYDRIKRMADDQNLSISYIEENAQLSNGSISKWKINIPRADSLYKVAKFLGCSVEFLISDHKNNFLSSDNHDNDLSYNNLSENDIEIINILRKFKTCRNQIKFIARVELLANEILANMVDEGQ